MKSEWVKRHRVALVGAGIVLLIACSLVPEWLAGWGANAKDKTFAEFEQSANSFDRELLATLRAAGVLPGDFHWHAEGLIDAEILIRFQLSAPDFARFAEAAGYTKCAADARSQLPWYMTPTWWHPDRDTVQMYCGSRLPFRMGYDTSRGFVFLRIAQI